eukprot:TRINITY_DN14596_c0_g2_i1.p1 TRINITY_DN14596_c0_g2~~TRINITY_DN14596_c0_g2_i1.p1  ORF type:complete len:467 (+),score=61.43 TRINITY_DN14596_c0_g2_i1:150-1550(+)
MLLSRRLWEAGAFLVSFLLSAGLVLLFAQGSDRTFDVSFRPSIAFGSAAGSPLRPEPESAATPETSIALVTQPALETSSTQAVPASTTTYFSAAATAPRRAPLQAATPTTTYIPAAVTAPQVAPTQAAPSPTTDYDPSAVKTPQVAPCACFKACNGTALKDFLTHAPVILDRNDSPWYAYVEAVYGKPPSLPFDVSSLRYFYHATPVWLAKHPQSFLPMAPCNRSKKPLTDLPNCSKDYCASWRDPRVDASKSIFVRGFNCHTYFHENPKGYSMGTLCEDSMASPLPPVPNFTWFEVARHAFDGEGTNAYGFWFKRAPGSGIWIYSGNTVHWQKKHETEYNQLLIRWLTYRNHSLKLAKDEVRLWEMADRQTIRSEKYMPFFPFIGWDMGYDTVQIHQSLEVILTTEFAMVVPGCTKKTLVEKLRFCSPGNSACAGAAELRAGWNASSICSCNKTKFVLNCDTIVS